MQSLQVLIDQLSYHRNIHISIVDLNGILNTQATSVDFKNVIHSKPFCWIAKSTQCGLDACLQCKQQANRKAVVGKKTFSGHCIYGLYEAAVPVIIEKNVAAIVYVGNAVTDESSTKERIRNTCHRTGVSEQALLSELHNCAVLDSPGKLLQIGEIVSDYLKVLWENTPKKSKDPHWLVRLMKRYAEENFSRGICLREIAITHQMNEKYIGRIFKQETGQSFHAYCMTLRLQKAEKMLLQYDTKIIDIAMECGFDNISYFNRMFRRQHRMSPTEYRKSNKVLPSFCDK